MIPEQPAKGEKAENGLVDEAGKTIREYACASISKVEEAMGEELEAGSSIFLWVIMWAAICYSRYAVGRDGRTGCERLRGRVCKAIVAPMGKKVWCERLRAGERQEAKVRGNLAWTGDGKLRDFCRSRPGGSQGGHCQEAGSVPEVGQQDDKRNAGNAEATRSQ